MMTRPDPALVEALTDAALAYGRAWADHNAGYRRATTRQSNALQAAHGASTLAARKLTESVDARRHTPANREAGGCIDQDAGWP